MTSVALLAEPVRPVARQMLAEGLALQQGGDTSGAHALYQAALAAAPDDPLALGLLGSLEGILGNAAAAEPLLRRAAEADPANPSTQFNLGVQQRKLNRLEDALASLDRAVALRPNSARFHRHRTEVFALISTRDQVKEAWRCLLERSDEAIAAGDTDSEWQFCKGLALLRLERPEDALPVFTALAAAEPGRTDARAQQGAALMKLKQYAQAREVLEKVIELAPDFVVARLLLGNVYVHLEECDLAIACFNEVAAESNMDSAPYMNLGTAYKEAGRLKESLACFDRAARLDPNSVEILCMRALCLLSNGDLARGWAEAEHRLADPVVAWARRDFGCPSWDGLQSVAGRTVLVWAEQGLGDAIHFSRYASALGKLGARVRLEVHPPLVKLLGSLTDVDEVVPFLGSDKPADFHCALMSLPHLLATHIDAIPSPDSYLRADEAYVAKWRSRMLPGRNVGVAWSGNPEHDNDHRRSLPLQKLLEYLPEGIHWWCVQKDVREADSPILDADGRIMRPELGDFADTAGLVANLDAVITVDTSVAHLSGALGRPILLLLPFAAEWRWQRVGTATPWYDSARLFRQPAKGDWDAVLRDVVAHLAA